MPHSVANTNITYWNKDWWQIYIKQESSHHYLSSVSNVSILIFYILKSFYE